MFFFILILLGKQSLFRNICIYGLVVRNVLVVKEKVSIQLVDVVVLYMGKGFCE